ncbi:MAG: ABC transporter permease [Bacteroidota bacterium]
MPRPYPMLRSYFRLAYRTLLKNKVASAINLVGLSIAIGTAITVFLFIHQWMTVNHVHENSDRTVLVHNIVERDGERQLWGDSPMPLGPALEADLPQVERAVRIEQRGATFRYTTESGVEKEHREWVMLAEPSFFEIFDYPVLDGEADFLTEPGAVALSPRMVEKYFGEDIEPLGQSFTVEFGGQEPMAFTVRAIVDPLDEETSFGFRALFPYETLRLLGNTDRDGLDDWASYTDATFLLLRDMDDLPDVAAALGPYVALQNAASHDWAVASLPLTPLEVMAHRSDEIRGDLGGGPPTEAVIVMGFIGVSLLLLACFNYVNVTLATAVRRLKEIGVRKTLGGQRWQLIAQFLAENVLLCLLALGLGIFVAHFVTTPGFNDISNLGIEADYLGSGALWLFLGAMLLVTAFVAGAYPAFYISGLRPASILRGTQTVSRHRWVQSSLLTLQFALAFYTMITCVVFVQNATYQEQLDWGYDEAQTLVVPFDNPSQFAAVEAEVAQHPDVVQYAGTRHSVGRSQGYAVLDVDGTQMEAVRLEVGPDYPATLDLRLRDGRLFDAERDAFVEDVAARGVDDQGEGSSGVTAAALVNATFVAQRGWERPLGQTFDVRRDSVITGSYVVAGVVEDFHYDDFFDPISPMFVTVVDEADYRAMALRVREGRATATFADLEAAWQRLYPDVEFGGYFQDAVFDEAHAENAGINRIFVFTAAMALLLASMGLFGIAAQNVARRMREIGIRKVLGATVANVTAHVNRGFLVMLLVAFVLASPFAYFILGALLDSIFEYRMPLNPVPFALAFGVVAVAAAATLATQVRRIMTANPADVLRAE